MEDNTCHTNTTAVTATSYILKFSLFSLLWLLLLKDSPGDILFLQTQQFVSVTLHFLNTDQEEIRNTAKQSQANLE